MSLNIYSGNMSDYMSKSEICEMKAGFSLTWQLYFRIFDYMTIF